MALDETRQEHLVGEAFVEVELAPTFQLVERPGAQIGVAAATWVANGRLGIIVRSGGQNRRQCS